MYYKSKYLNTILCNNNVYAYHSLFGNLSKLDRNDIDILDKCDVGIVEEEIENNEEYKQVIINLHKNFFIVTEEDIERNIIKELQKKWECDVRKARHINGISFNVTNKCNFSCTHCLPMKAKETNSSVDIKYDISFDEVKIIIDEFFLITPDDEVEEKQFFFGGREPLLKWKLIFKICDYINIKAMKKDFKCLFIIFTNASLVNSVIAQKLKEYRFLVFSSFEGLYDINDKQRMYNNGEGTFNDIVKGWRELDAVNWPVTGGSLTLTKMNYLHINMKDTFEFLKKYNINGFGLNVDFTSQWLEDDIDKLVGLIMEAVFLGEKENIYVSGQWEVAFMNLFRNATNSMRHSFCNSHSGYSINMSPGNYFKLCPDSNSMFYSDNGLQGLISDQRYIDAICSRQVGRVLSCIGCNIEGFCAGGCSVCAMVIENTNRETIRCIIKKKIFANMLENYLIKYYKG